MQPLLYLVHRIPFPPNKGDKIRSFHLLKTLSMQFEIYLGAFVDEQEDWCYKNELKKYCKDIKLCTLNPFTAKIRSMKGFFTGEPLTLPYYLDKNMADWVSETVKSNNIRKVMVYSSPMAQYVDLQKFEFTKRVADFVDIDSDKWFQYSKTMKFPLNIVYGREAKRLADYERKISNSFDATLFVSEEELKDFNNLAPESVCKQGFYNNGVDMHYFNPHLSYENPYEPEMSVIVFTGAMDYWANIDAVKWFAEKIFKTIQTKNKNIKFFIVGAKPTKEVRELENIPGVIVTGTVDDIRPYIRFASIVVAPLRIARGVQNKVLEAMAMARPIVATRQALEGITMCKNYSPLQADNEDQYVEICNSLLNRNKNLSNDLSARNCVQKNYNWSMNTHVVIELLKSDDREGKDEFISES